MCTDFLEYLFPDRSFKWRIQWYNEIKIPMLTAGILVDNGQDSLLEKTKLLHSIVLRGFDPPLPGDSKALCPEEEFIQIALKSQAVHARAKLIIMQILNQIQNPDLCLSKSNVRFLDYKRASATQVFQEMLSIIKAENPKVVEKVLMEGSKPKPGESPELD